MSGTEALGDCEGTRRVPTRGALLLTGLFSFKVFVQFTRRVASWSSLLQRIR